MMRNVPKKYTAWDLVYELDRFTARDTFDFVYVPWDRSSVTNMSYAFVNFVDSHVADVAAHRMSGVEWVGGQPGRVIRIMPARVQGLFGNLQRFRDEVASRGGVIAAHTPLVFGRGAYVAWDVALSMLSGGPGAAAARSLGRCNGAFPWPPCDAHCVPANAAGATFGCTAQRLPYSGWGAADSEENTADAASCDTEGDSSSSSEALRGSQADAASDSPARRLTAAQLEGLSESKKRMQDLLLRVARVSRSGAWGRAA